MRGGQPGCPGGGDPRRLAAGLGLCLLLLGACRSARVDLEATPPPVPPAPETVAPVPAGPGSAAAALRALCDRPPVQRERPVRPEGPAPPAIAEVQQQVEEVRGLRFRRPVAAEPVTREELVRRLREAFARSYPAALYRRRSLAWAVMGLISPGASIRAEVEEFLSGAVIGFYVPATGELVFLGEEEPGPLARVTLAHELTHAIDDQHFDLGRLDELEAACRDEELMAALGVVEGSAQYFSLRVGMAFLTPEEQLSLLEGNVPDLSGVEPFVLRLQAWPYAPGLAFVSELAQRGGTGAVDRALRELPASTEQVLHPERYPADLPQPVDVADLARALGKGWRDLDVMEVGEAWLAIMLGLRLEEPAAEAAAAGWDGGLYRAWSRGRRVAVVLATVWDTEQDAEEFAGAVADWIRPGQPAAVERDGAGVRVLFASDGEVLETLRSAA